MKLIKEQRVKNLDQYIPINVLQQFAKSKTLILNAYKRSQVLWMQDMYADYINKRNLN